MKDFILEGMTLSERDVILSIINTRFIIDYGTVTANNGDGTVNIQHAVPMTPKYPTSDWVPTTPTITNNVEVLYLSGAQFSSNFKITIGDPVLLVGFKDFVQNTKSLNGQPLTVFNHYNQNTLKCIPLAGSNTNALAQINVVNGLLQIKTQTQSLLTILNSILSHLEGLTTINCVPGSPVTLSSTTIGLLQADALNLAQLLTA